MWSDMSLAVHSDGASWEFVVTYQLPIDAAGYQVYALRKTPGEANGFVLFDELFTSSAQTSFSFVGGIGTYVEAFNFVHP